MQEPPIPSDEAQRLRELYSYEVLDTATEAALDAIVQEAALVCGTDFGALTMVDWNRQWFKAQCGFSLKETVRGQSICGHGILSRSFFEVPDTEADERFCGNPLLHTLGVRFYGGTQLIGAEGNVLGMLCVLDAQPRQLSPLQKTRLTSLAIQAMELLETRRQRRRMQWLGEMINKLRDEIYLFDLTTQVLLFANEAAIEGGGVEVGVMSVEDVTPAVDAKTLHRHMHRLKAESSEVSYDTLLERSHGQILVEARWQRLSGTGHGLAMCTLRDLSGRRQGPV